MTDFGFDLSCTDDLTLEMSTIDGSKGDVRIVAEAIYRRLITPRGMLIDDLDYGYDLKLLLNKSTNKSESEAIPGIIRQEILKDERIETVDVKVNIHTINQIDLSIQCTTALGPFDLVISVSQAATILQSINI